MKIALTGGTGFIGQFLIQEYSDKHEFVVYTPREDTQTLFQSPSVCYEHVDRPNSNTSTQFNGLETCDAAINLGFARPQSGVVDTLDHYLTSLQTTDRFFAACASAGIRNVVHISSRLVYDESLPVPHYEDEAPRPASYYGVAKLAAETLALRYVARNELDIKILRFSQVIGAGEKQGLIAVYAKNAKSGLPLNIWGSGTESLHEYLYVRDACSAIIAALVHPNLCGVYNVGSGEMVNTLQVAQMINDISGGTLEIVTMPEKRVPSGKHLISSEKIAEEMGWHPQWPVQSALRDILS